jgi:hypothetical protein
MVYDFLRLLVYLAWTVVHDREWSPQCWWCHFFSLTTFVNNVVPTVDGYSKHFNCPAAVVSSNVASWRLPLYQGISNRSSNRFIAGELQMVLRFRCCAKAWQIANAALWHHSSRPQYLHLWVRAVKMKRPWLRTIRWVTSEGADGGNFCRPRLTKPDYSGQLCCSGEITHASQLRRPFCCHS